MKKFEELKGLKKELESVIADISVDFANVYDLTCSGYICDAITEYSDSQIDIYYSDLKKWLQNDSEAVGYFERAINEGLTNTTDFDFFQAIQSAQYLKNSEELYNDYDDIIKIMIINYLIDLVDEFDLIKIEDFEAFIDEIEKDHDNKFYYLADKIREKIQDLEE